MKISQQQLNQIIREEVQAALKEVNPVPTPTSSKEDLTKLQGTKDIGKHKNRSSAFEKARAEKVKQIKKTPAQKKKEREDAKKRSAETLPPAEKKRKADKAKKDAEKERRKKIDAKVAAAKKRRDADKG
jgi:hypothetical protein